MIQFVFSNSRQRWIATDGKTEIELPPGGEGVKLMAKLDTAKAIIRAAQQLAPIADSADALIEEFTDAGEFLDADLTALGITAADLTAAITLLRQLRRMLGNQTVTQAAYGKTINKLRRVQV